jgi:nucleoside phosphorylase
MLNQAPRNPDHVPVLICFAVEDEARHFRKQILGRYPCQILITGIGPGNAKQSLLDALKDRTPSLVLSSGFAGGLNPELRAGEVGFEGPGDSSLAAATKAVGARPMRFHSSDRIASTASAKLHLWRATAADAVEMESGPIREICAQRNIPSATIRVISDAAEEDLPLDFNLLMTPEQRLDYFKLAWTLVKSPAKVARLLAFQRRIDGFAAKLATVLCEVLVSRLRR